MLESPNPAGPPHAPDTIGRVPATGTSPAQRAGEPGVAFRALLERLEGQARGLAHAGDDLREPEQLADAVDRARTSLADALSLGEELLEALRAARHGAADERRT